MAAKLDYYKEQAVKMLYEKNALTDHLAVLEQKTQVKREYIAAGVVGLLILYLIFGYGAQLICNVIAFVYPAYCSIKALESTRKEDDTRWLTYWVVFALFSVVEFFSDILLSWFPLYWLAKCGFFIWCFLPNAMNGSDVIYARVIRPFFMKHENKIDSVMNQATDAIHNKMSEIASELKSD